MNQTTQPTERLLTIKKYPNRRYYDATRSRHVTFEEIYELVRDGYDVQITDSKSGEDITAKVLAQLIIELDPLKLGVFPVPLLHGLLRATPQAMTEYARRYWAQMFGSLAESQRDVGQYVSRMMGLPSEAFPPQVADWARMMWGNTGSAGNGGSGAPEKPSAEKSEESGGLDNGSDLREELEALSKQMEVLKKRLGASSGKKQKARRRR